MSAYGDGGLGLLGDPMRRAIFEKLAQRPSSVGELADQLPISRPAVSQHLKALKDGGLVVSQPQGTRRVYRLNPQGVAALRSWLDGVWEHALADFHKCAEQTIADEHRRPRPSPDHSSEEQQMNAQIPAIEGKTTVNVSRDRAFALFTESFGTWWPRQYHIGAAEVADVVLEPGEGGRWFERGVDGSECDWGRVLNWEPPERVVFTWQIGGNWQFDPDPAHASEIEVRFHADGPEQTTVEVEHRHFDRLVGGDGVYGAIEHGGGGWVALLAAYAQMVESQQ